MTSGQVRQYFSGPRIHMGAIGTTELTTIAAKTDRFRFFGKFVSIERTGTLESGV